MKNLAIILIVLISLLMGNISKAQNLGIGPDTFTPAVSAGVEMRFANKGLLIPRVSLASTTSTSPITTPIANSLLVYNKASAGAAPNNVTPGFYYYDSINSKWMRFATTKEAWLLSGNAGTSYAINFLGTTDAQPLVIKTNNLERVRITTKGQIETYNTGKSVFIGEGAGASDDLSNNNNVFIGYQSGNSNTTGILNTANGTAALYSNTAGSYNTANGAYALYSYTGTDGRSNYNTAIGYNALYSNTAGSNTANGAFALYSNTTGSNNTANGNEALYSNTTGYRNTANGVSALRSNTTGIHNTATGVSALYYNTTGNYNVANGYQALYSNTTGYDNVANGTAALLSNTTGSQNTATGSYALRSNTTGYMNTAIGDSALFLNTTGYYNTANGKGALLSNTTGYRNTANGFQALYYNTTGYMNTAIGYAALSFNTTGFRNTANGTYALHKNTTGYYNTANGYNALVSNTTGDFNTANGYQALYSNESGINNTAIGHDALYQNTTGNYNTAIGYRAFFNGNYNNSTAIGYDAQINNNNQIRIGNASVSSIGGYADWEVQSDMRFKKDVKEDVPGLDFIMKLKPVTYYLDMDAIAEFNNTPDSLRLKDAEALKGKMLQTGFIAQDVEKVASECGFEFSGVDAPQNENGYYGLRYATFVVPLVKAVQEQQTIIDKQQKEIESLKSELQELRQLVIENQKSK